MGALRWLTSDNARQQRNLGVLEERVARKLRIVQALISRDLPSDRRIACLEEGQRATDAVRQIIAAMHAEEERLLVGRYQDAEAATAGAQRVLLGGGALAALLFVTAVAVIDRDIVRRRRDQEALRDREAQFRAVVEQAREAIFFFDADTLRLRTANAAMCELLGYTSDELTGRTLYEIVAHDPRSIERNVAEVAARGGKAIGERLYRHKDGSLVDVEVSAKRVTHGGDRTTFCVVARDVSERKRLEAQQNDYRDELEAQAAELAHLNEQLVSANVGLELLATRDALTGLHNRRACDAALEAEMARARRHNTPLALLLLDVDRFKQYNDSFGHPAGDAVLRVVGDILRSAARLTDIPARYGGEEMAVVLPETGAEGAGIFGERVRAAIEAHPWAEREVTVSVGVASLAAGMDGSAALLWAADAALYRAKAGGRNRVEAALPEESLAAALGDAGK